MPNDDTGLTLKPCKPTAMKKRTSLPLDHVHEFRYRCPVVDQSGRKIGRVRVETFRQALQLLQLSTS
jgi:hypothetical protein